MAPKQPIVVERGPEPPAHLSEGSAALWLDLVTTRASSPERRALILAALEARDRAECARQAIERDGMMLAGGDIAHANPLLKVQKDGLALFARIWSDLGLSWNPGVDTRMR